MRPLQLVHRSLIHYWRTNLAVIAGVGVAVAVLAGALLVGESVRASLLELAVGRLGRTDDLIASTQFFRRALVDDLGRQSDFAACCAKAYGLIAVDGLVTRPDSGGRAAGVAVYGIDEGFWAFHGRSSPGALRPREAWISPALARELGPSDEGAGGSQGAVLVRLQQPSAIPLSTLHGRREEAGRTIRATVRGVLPVEAMGEFSLRPVQGDVRAIFLPIARLQADLNQPGRINAVLVSRREGGAADGTIARALGPVVQLEDAGLKTRMLPDGSGFILDSESGLLTDAIADVAMKTAATQQLETTPVLTYLAYAIRSGDREVPYSVVSAIDLDATQAPAPDASAATATATPIWLNAWTADALQVKPGAPITLAYDVWDDAGGLVRHESAFTLAGVLPMSGVGGDATLTPEYPGITGEESLSEWDPPFPLDLSRITPRDEAYWKQYRAAPKAFVRLADGQRVWGSRFGKLTSLRIAFTNEARNAMNGYREALRGALQRTNAGFVVRPVRALALTAASGTTDFGEYFLYFSFFIVVSGLLLAGLFFRLGVEQRVREVGLMQAIGYTPALVTRLFLIEGAYLAIAGSLVGVLGALAYASLIMLGLRTWWVGAVGTTALTLKPSASALAIGALAGIVTAVLAIALTLRGVTRVPARTLLHGDIGDAAADFSSPTVPAAGAATAAARAGARPSARARRRRVWFGLSLVLAIALTAASALRLMDQTGGFFGAGGLALIAALLGLSIWLRRAPTMPTPVPTTRGLWRFGQINAAARPGRTVLSVALIAFATFVIVTVGAFRQEGVASPNDPRSGTGGYALIAESVAPITDDPNTAAGRATLALDSPDIQPVFAGTAIARFRVRPGDDGSCLNLYRPENPRLVAPTEAFVRRGGRFTFAGSLAETDAERANPWLLLNRRFPDGAVPAIVDQTSAMYVFHKSLGDDIVVPRAAGDPVTLRLVATLSHSLFQSELIIGEAAFVRLFPGNDGYRLFLISGEAARAEAIGRTLENRLADFGVEVTGTVDRLRAYQQVENTYLSTFQALGALGLVLGTLGVGTVLLRNILERRREIGLLQAIGYRRGHVRGLILAESVSLVVWGLAAGSACALLAVLPAIVEHGGRFPWMVMTTLLVAVLAAGFVSSIVATALAVRLPLLASLRAE